jgi:hypothetical protein
VVIIIIVLFRSVVADLRAFVVTMLPGVGPELIDLGDASVVGADLISPVWRTVASKIIVVLLVEEGSALASQAFFLARPHDVVERKQTSSCSKMKPEM